MTALSREPLVNQPVAGSRLHELEIDILFLDLASRFVFADDAR